MPSHDDVATFARDGAVVLRGQFDAALLGLLAEGVQASLDRPSRHTAEYVSGSADQRFFYDTVMVPDSPVFQAFIGRSGLGETVAGMMGSGLAIAFYLSVFVRAAGTAKRTPWHQDMPFWAASGGKGCSTWIPLDAVPRSTALEFVRGSHRWPPLARPDFRDQPQDDYLDGEKARARPFPDIEGARSQFDIIGWDMAPGDCLVFHGMTAHGGSGDLPPGLGRRTVSIQWLGDDAVYDPKPGGHDPDFAAELEALGVRPGESPACALCPVVWP